MSNPPGFRLHFDSRPGVGETYEVPSQETEKVKTTEVRKERNTTVVSRDEAEVHRKRHNSLEEETREHFCEQ